MRHTQAPRRLRLVLTVMTLWPAAISAPAALGATLLKSEEMARAKSALLAVLPAAQSAQFRDVTLTRSSNTAIFCGSVEVKDRSGRDLGFEPFIVLGQQARVYTEDQSFENFKEMWSMTCNAGHKTPVPGF